MLRKETGTQDDKKSVEMRVQVFKEQSLNERNCFATDDVALYCIHKKSVWRSSSSMGCQASIR